MNIPEYENQDFSKIEQFAKRSGDLKSLSMNDQGILALCLYLERSYKKQYNNCPKLTLITDDYSIQNVARLLEISTQSFKYKGIKKYIQWEIYCKTCFKIYNPSMFGKECFVCGDIIKRRPRKRRKRKL